MLQWIAGELGIEAPGQSAQPIGREVKRGGRGGGIDGRERVAGGQEDDVAERARRVALLLHGGLPHDDPQAIPGAEEDRADGVGTRQGTAREHGHQFAARLEQEPQQFVANSRVWIVAGQVLDDER